MAFQLTIAQLLEQKIRDGLDVVKDELAQYPATDYAKCLDALFMGADDRERLIEQLRDGKDAKDGD